MRNIRVGIIGLGKIGQLYAEVFSKIPRVQLTAMIDTDRRKEAIAKKYDATFIPADDGSKFLAKTDVVVIATPPNVHVEEIIQALDAGKHVLCEKPVVTEPTDLEIIQRAARTTNKVFMVASHLRYHPAMKVIYSRPEIRSLEAIFEEDIRKYSTESTWVCDAVRSGGGCVIDSGINAFDCMLQFVGPITIKNASLGYKGFNHERLPVETMAEIHFQFGDRYPGRLRVSWIAQQERREIQLKIREKDYVVDFIDHSLSSAGPQTNLLNSYVAMVNDFLAKIKTGYKETSGFDALRLVFDVYEKKNVMNHLD